jgi:GYF domain 2
MSQGNDFANYSAASNAGTGGSDEVWFVAVASDDIKQMTIDQLDEAFRLGVITGETPVWTEGMEAWAPLAQVADLDSDSGTQEAVKDEPAMYSGNMGGFGGSSSGGFGGSSSGGFGGSHTGGGAFGAVTLQSVQHSFAPGPSSFAPVTASYAPGPHVGQSSLPVAINGDEDASLLQRGRGSRPTRWVLAGVAALLAVGVVAYNNLSSSVASAGTEAAAPTLAARPYGGAEAADRGSAPATSAPREREAAPARDAQDEASGAAVVAAAATAASTNAKAMLVASDDGADEPPVPVSKKGSEKESLKNSFSKSLSKKGTSGRSAKVKPRRAASRASTKARASKAKKPTVVRAQSAFDPLNDSLP